VSRIGRQPVPIPKGVEVKVDGQTVTVKGAKGTLTRQMHPAVSVKVDGGTVTCTTAGETRLQKSVWGMSRMLIANMVTGVVQGYEKKLEIIGVGYKAEMKGQDMVITIGYSHPVVIKAEKGLSLSAEGPSTIVVRGPDKETVGRVAAALRNVRLPEPYKGKGIRYVGEEVKRKAGKTAAK